jgi:GNAT superfamily N-acetyltransferase
MNGQVEIVEGGDWSRAAAQLLMNAWPRPVLEYTEAGLRWQMEFPGRGRMAGIWHQGQLIALGADTPRRVRWANQEQSLRILSFVAVEPQWRGRGLAAAIYRGLLAGLDSPVLTFALRDSAGARLIENLYPEMGFHLTKLEPCVVLGQLPRRWDEAWQVTEIEAEQWRPASAADVLAMAPDQKEREHWARDPRQGCFVQARHQTSGESVFAWVVISRVLQASGEVSQAVSLECVTGGPGGTGALGAIAAWANRWQGGEGVVRAANLSCWDLQELRQLGWRQISTPFDSWLATPPGKTPAAPRASLAPVT